MPKYWGKTYFAHGSFPEVGQKQKTEKERAKEGERNGQATHGARKHAWRTQAAWAKSTEVNIQLFFLLFTSFGRGSLDHL